MSEPLRSNSAEISEQTAAGTPDDAPLLEVEQLKKHFPVNTGFLSSIQFDREGLMPFELDDSVVRAVDGVSFRLAHGETFGVVGESGCGKSTLARTLLGLEKPTDGTIRFNGNDVTTLTSEQETWFRENVQMVYQDPQSSLNPRRKVGSIITDPLEGAGWDEPDQRERALQLLEDVGLKREYYSRYPHECSGGQRQRINLARALSINPDLVVADEPVSGLDTSVQAQILELMNDLQAEYNLTYLVITHDLGVIRNIADRVAVMYVGDFVELGSSERLFTNPHHPYTRELLGAVPNPDPEAPAAMSRLVGDVPSPENPPTGCKFHTRCPEVITPEGFDRDEYRRLAEFRQALIVRKVDETTPEEIIDTYFWDGVPAAAEAEIRVAATDAAAGNWNDAEAALAQFETSCMSETPSSKEISGPNHHSACHLDITDRERFSR
jgi:peptide/nickel transport system ATP-binding protein